MSEPECVSRDKRGWIYLIKLSEGKEAIVIFTRKGFLRGGEYHNCNQRTVVISGLLLWTAGRHGIWFGGKKMQRQGEGFVIPRLVPHLAEALEDTVYVEWLEGEGPELGKTLVPEMRKLVEEKMKE